MPEWNSISEKGRQTAQSVTTPKYNLNISDKSRNREEGIRSQKDRLLRRGNAISATPNIKGISQLPKPPIEIGMTIKEIITKA